MKFKLGFPAEPVSLLKQPAKLTLPLKKTYTIATIVGLVILMPAIYLIWRLQWGDDVIFGVFREDTIFPLLAAIATTVILHELAHLIAHPHLGLSDWSYAGVDQKTGFAYVQYLGTVSKLRFFAMGLMPLILGTALPLWLSTIYPECASFIAFVSIFNAVGAGADVFILWTVWREVPKGKYLQGLYFGDLLN